MGVYMNKDDSEKNVVLRIDLSYDVNVWNDKEKKGLVSGVGTNQKSTTKQTRDVENTCFVYGFMLFYSLEILVKL